MSERSDRRKSLIGLFTLTWLLLAGPANAWDGVQTGKITGIDLTQGNNQAVRIYLDGVASMCGTSAAWAYMNTDYSNYQATVAAIMSAWLNGKAVILYTTATAGYCQIGYVHVSD